MSYVKDTLGQGEQILYWARYHWSYTLVALLALLSLGIFVIGLVIFVHMMIRKWTTEIAVTSERFVFKTGWISRHTQEVSLQRIEEVNLHQGFFGRLLGYGRLRLHGTGVGVIELPNIDNPLELRRQITNAKDTTSLNAF